MVRKIIGAFCIIMTISGLVAAGTGASSEGPVACVIIAAIFAVPGLWLLLKKGKTKEEKAELKAKKQKDKDIKRRTLDTQHIAGLPLACGSYCAVHFEDSEIVVTGGESTFRVPFEKIVNLRIDTKSNVERYAGYSLSGALIGGAAYGPLGAAFLGVKEKKRRRIEEYLVITYNSRENYADTLAFFLLSTTMKVNYLVKEYLPRCGGRRPDITL